MPRIEFEQAEVISAAGRAWHKGEPAIIQENGFPVASIVFTGESKNSFAGYGVILDFQITDSEGDNYAAQIGKKLVATAAESQFPGDYTKAKVVEDPHNLIPSQLVRRYRDTPDPLLELLFGSGKAKASAAVIEEQKAAKPESFSKRIRREVKALMSGVLPNHGAFKTGENGKTIVAWRKEPGSSFIYIATATASEKDRYREEIGARIAYKRLIDGQSIALPMPHDTDAEKFAIRMFGRYERAMATALENEYNTKTEALRKEYAERGVEWLKCD